MTEPYCTEDQKFVKLANPPKWTFDECQTIHEILFEKGYLANAVSRVGSDCNWHHALRVKREDIPQLIEELFRQRISVEVQPEGSWDAAITFVYDESGSTVISAVHRFRKNKLNGGKL